MRVGQFNVLPPVVKNLLIINGLFFVAAWVLQDRGIAVNQLLGLPYWTSDLFRPHQIVTHMFMHADVPHLLSNMFALWMFGSVLENVWGGKRFLVFYLLTGLGAAILYNLVRGYDIYNLSSQLSPEYIDIVRREGFEALKAGMNYRDPLLAAYNETLNGSVRGASGAVFGILTGYGMLFPNTYLYLYFTIPVKAKYFVIGYGALELFLGIQNNPSDNVAHYAHLGGMLFGFLLIKYWNKTNRRNFY